MTRRLPGQPRSRSLLAYSWSRASWRGPCCLLLPSKSREPPPPQKLTISNKFSTTHPHPHPHPHKKHKHPLSLIRILGLPSFHSFQLHPTQFIQIAPSPPISTPNPLSATEATTNYARRRPAFAEQVSLLVQGNLLLERRGMVISLTCVPLTSPWN